MIKFVIVDRELSWVELTKKIVNDIVLEYANVSIETHNGYSDELEKTIEDNSTHKVYILEIDLGNSLSGLEIAQKIRATDHLSHIIFLTNNDGMFEAVYRNVYEVYTFIEKFHDAEKKLVNAVKSIIKIEFDKGMFRYSIRGYDLQIFYKEILYIVRNSQERNIVIHTKQSKFAINATVDRVLALLDSRFHKVHRACIVNDDEVISYNWAKDEFVLRNGEVIPLLSKKYRKIEKN